MPTSIQTLQEHGQCAWVDELSRRFVHQGELATLLGAGVVGVTSNPTIFQGAIASGDGYDEQLDELLGAGTDPKEAFLALARDDIRDACDLLRELFDRTHAAGGHTAAGWVSLEVDPSLADDTEASIEEARRLHRMVNRPNLLVRIPGTEAGLPAIEEVTALGIPVNVTLLFSLSRHHAAAQAYLRGLRRLADAEGDLCSVTSVASFFLSRVDAEADRRLEETDGPAHLRGRLAIANAELAYQTYRELFTGPEWAELAQAGASAQRCLWASTGVKNPDYRDVRYVEELVGPQTVTTMPRDTVRAFLDHGQVADTLQTGVDAARDTLAQLADAGIDYEDLVQTLERDGVGKFASSYQRLIDEIADKADRLAPR